MKDNEIKLIFNNDIKELIENGNALKKASVPDLCNLYNISFKANLKLEKRIEDILCIDTISEFDLKYILKNVCKSSLKLTVFIRLLGITKNKDYKLDCEKIFSNYEYLYDEAVNVHLQDIVFLDMEKLKRKNIESELYFMIFFHKKNFSENYTKSLMDIFNLSKSKDLDLSLQVKGLMFVYNELFLKDSGVIWENLINYVDKLLSGVNQNVVKILILKYIDFNTELGLKLKIESLNL